MKVRSKKLVNVENETERFIHDVVVSQPGLLIGRGPMQPTMSVKTVEEVPVERETFEVVYECGHCHHTWTENLTVLEKR